MPKTKMVVAIILSALVLSTSTSASASTAGWMLNGTLLSGSAALATTAVVDEPYTLSGGGVNLECGGPNDFDGTLHGKDSVLVGHENILGCSTELANCSVDSTYSTLPLVGEATLEGALADKVTFKPATGTLFSTIKFSGEKCAIAGVVPISGKATSKLVTGQDERTSQLLQFNITEASKELFIGGTPLALKAGELVKVQSGQTWSFL
jgi:hypothetical protein